MEKQGTVSNVTDTVSNVTGLGAMGDQRSGQRGLAVGTGRLPGAMTPEHGIVR